MKNLNNLKKLFFVLILCCSSSSIFAQIDVLVCGAASPQSWLDDVQTKLIGTGQFNSVTTYNTYLTGTPTLAYMQGFDAILVYTDYGAQDPTTLGNNLAAYIDGGGGVVNCVFSNASVPIGGNFNTTTYHVIVPASQNSSPQLQLGAILDSCHPIIQGITSFDGGTSSYRSTSNTLAPGGQIIANWSNGEWLVATKNNVGPMNARRADLNFYPPSSDARSDFWLSNTQGDDLMANALLWVAGATNYPNAPATPGAISGGNEFCENTSTGYSIASVANAVNYVWTVPAGTTILSGQGTTSITVDAGPSSGNITVTAYNSCNQPSPAASILAVTYNPLPVLSLLNDSIDCNNGLNGLMDLTVTSGTPSFSYAWNTSATTQDLNGVGIGSYSVTVTDAEGCTATASATVDAPPAYNVSTSVINDTCFGASAGAVNLTVSGATGGYSYLWSNGSTSQDINGVNAANYTVTITDSRGCTTTTSAPITEPAAINANYSIDNVTCNGLDNGSISVNASGGTGGYTYQWSNSASTSINDDLSAGSYSIIITDNTGCTFEDTVTVTEPIALNITGVVTPETTGNDGAVNITVSGGTPTYIYNWSNSATSEDISGVTGGTYTIIVTDANQCTDTATFIVTSHVGINENSDLFVNVYPNPATEFITVQTQGTSAQSVQVLTVTGQIIYSSVIQNEISTINVSGFAPGIYYLQILKPEKLYTKQFIVK